MGFLHAALKQEYNGVRSGEPLTLKIPSQCLIGSDIMITIVLVCDLEPREPVLLKLVIGTGVGDSIDL